MKRSFRRWTIRERMFIEQHYATMQADQIAYELGRESISVKRYINNNGFRKYRKCYQPTIVI